MITPGRHGTITISAFVFPERHELETASFLATNLGKDVDFLATNRTKGARTPDIKMDGVLWEMKCPFGHSKTTVANALRRAVKQSANVIIDTRQMKIADDIITKELIRNVPLTRSLRRLLLVTKRKTIVVLK